MTSQRPPGSSRGRPSQDGALRMVPLYVNLRSGCEDPLYCLQGRPCGRPPAAAVLAPAATRQSPGHRPHRHRSRHRHRTLIDTSSSPGFGHAKEKGPDCRQQRRDLAGLGRVSQRPSASTRTALAAAALAEPLGEALPDGRAGLLGDLQQEGPQRLAEDLQEESREQPPQGSSPHAGAETDQRYRLHGGTRGQRKSAPPVRDAPRRWPCLGTLRRLQPNSVNRSSHRSSSLVTGAPPPVVAPKSGQSGQRRSPLARPADSRRRLLLSARAAGRQVCVPLVRAGSVGHREPLVLGGHERSTSANQHRRSEALHRLDLGRRSSPALGSNPTSGPKAAQVGDRMALSSWWPAAAGSSGRWPILTESMTDVARSGWSHWRTISEGSTNSISKEMKTKPPHNELGRRDHDRRPGLACRGQQKGSPCQARSMTRSAAAPRERSVPGPRLVYTPSEPSGSQRSPAVSSSRSFAQVVGAILGKQARGQNPDKDEVGGSSPPRPTIWPLTSRNASVLLD
jgi:hypothetical protein